jgi:hypothetical protein
MFSKRQFTPGNNSNASRVINYTAEYNNRNPDSAQISCLCNGNIYNKNVLSSDSASQRETALQRISYLCRINAGGTPQYGDLNLGKPVNLNYLGKNEGMPGGSGSPPVNKF